MDRKQRKPTIRSLAVTGFGFAAIALVALDIALDLPFPLIALAFALIFVIVAFLGRGLRIRNIARLRHLRSRSFKVTSNGVFVTDDFNFTRGDTIPAANGHYTVSVSVDEEFKHISRATILSDSDDAFMPDRRPITVDFGLIYIVDSSVASSPRRTQIVRDLVASTLPSPVFEVLWDADDAFGVVIEPGFGNGEYHLDIHGASVVCDFAAGH